MYDTNNIFAKILRGEISCRKIYEDECVLFFYDINPIAKIHVLGIPKVECKNFEDFVKISSKETIANFFKKVSEVASKLKINNSGYRIITNTGINGGQEVHHFHVHILGGEKIGSKIK